MIHRLPIVGSDVFTWGGVLNDWLSYNSQRVVDSSNVIDVSVQSGDAVYWDSSNLVYKQAQAGYAYPVNVIGMKSHTDTTATIVNFGPCDTTASLVLGSTYYLDTSAGRITNVEPTVNIVKVGRALSTSRLFIDIEAINPLLPQQLGNSSKFLTTDGTNSSWTSNIFASRIFVSLGTTLITGDLALSAGWGNAASISSVLGTDSRATFTVTSSGTGQTANPTITLTFHDGTWTTAPFAIVQSNGGTGNQTLPTWTSTATTLVITVPITPVSGSTYTFSFIIVG